MDVDILQINFFTQIGEEISHSFYVRFYVKNEYSNLEPL